MANFEDDDRLMDVRVVMHLRVNRDAYEREYGNRMTAQQLREDVKQSVYNTAMQAAYPEDSGVIVDGTLDN